MPDHAEPNIPLLQTARQRAVFELLRQWDREEGVPESTSPEDLSDQEGTAMILDMALSAYPTEEHLMDHLTWGTHPNDIERLRPLAKRLLALGPG